MNKAILSSEVQQFISENLEVNLSKLILKGSPFPNISIQELAQQIEGKSKCKKKLPLWFETENIYLPKKLNLEQTSSEITADYKAKLVSGSSLIDLTGGFGIDSYYFSKRIKKVTHCELNQELSEIVKHNNEQFPIQNIQTVVGDSLEYLQSTQSKFDWIYIDPSRRNDTKGKVFLLKDCLPNVPEHLDVLFEKTNNILIKNSPILDITSTIRELKFTKEIHIVAVKNEVKEVLFILEKNYQKAIQIKTCNIVNTEQQLFDFEHENSTIASYNLPSKYLYEPNTAILKSGGFQEVSSQLKIDKLHQHSHLYTSEKHIPNFPGRTFIINKILPYDKKKITKELPEKKANIAIRNFPETVAQIRKKTKLKDGGDNYLFFTTDINHKKIVLICTKV